MRPTRTAVLLTAGLVTLFGTPAATAAEPPSHLYVSNHDGSGCSDAGSGTRAVPYCTVTAAAKAVEPGQTVLITTGKPYPEGLTVDRSGKPGKPITFLAAGRMGAEVVELTGGKGVSVTGASHVVLGGLKTPRGLRVTGSTDVVMDRMEPMYGFLDSVVVGGASKDVRLSRSRLSTVRIEGGAQGTVLSHNFGYGGRRPAVVVADAPGTVLTNNTLHGHCGAIVAVDGSSTGSAVFNNVLFAESTHDSCEPAPGHWGLAVEAAAAAGTRVGYNVITGLPQGGLTPYRWSGTDYKDPAAFLAGTGRGARDILTPSGDGVGPRDGSPTVDSADATAPGVLAGDFDGSPTADDPRVPNTGKDGGYLDRGAYETQDHLSRVLMHTDQTWAPVGTEVVVQTASDSEWPSAMTYHVDFGDGTPPVVTRQVNGAFAIARHVYGTPGDHVVKVTAVNAVGVKAVTEQRVKASPAGPPVVSFTAEPALPAPGDTTTHLPPLTVTFDASASSLPWPVQSVEVLPGDGLVERRDGLGTVRYTYKRPGEYQATVHIRDVKGNTATQTRTVRADYTASGFVATEPFRLLDSRVNGGTLGPGASTPVRMPIGLHASGSASAGMSAAVVNVTLTGATQDAFLNVSPYRQDAPTTSNLNVKAGGTVSNTVTVPVDDSGFVWLRLNAGRADVIVDFVGYYQPGSGDRFSPVAPTRLVDTRATGGAVPGGTTRTVKVAGVNGIPADARAVAVNLTSTDTTSNSYVLAYPDPAKRPVASNLNPEPGKDKSNQAIVPVGPNGTITLYNNAGSTHLVVDAVGYYGKNATALFTPMAPKRLADTRTTGKLAPGGTTTAAGLPSTATGAVLNVTATDTTAPGFLTVYGYGAARPQASSLNTLPGLTVPNHVTTPVAGGRVSVYNSGAGANHVITDLLGYFSQG